MFFQGRELDPATGLYDFRNRWYSAELGRFLSRDPSGYPDGPNQYAAFGANPAMFMDPSGLARVTAHGGVNYLGDYLNEVENPGIGSVLLDAAGNTLSDLLGLDIIADGTTVAGDSSNSASDRIKAGTKATAMAAVDLAGGKILGWAGGKVLGSKAGRWAAGRVLGSRAGQKAIEVLTSDVRGLVGRAAGGGAASAAKAEAAQVSSGLAGELVGPSRPGAYSTAFETRLSSSSYPGVSRGSHFGEANDQLLKAMDASPELAEMMQNLGIGIERSSTGLAPRTSPSGWTWHHAVEPGVMQLVPRAQHVYRSPFWDLFHPNGRGGFSIWGK